jgi:hypothetical protein
LRAGAIAPAGAALAPHDGHPTLSDPETNTMNKRTSLVLIALAGGSLLAACNSDSNLAAANGASEGGVGSVSLALQVAPGVTINSFSYSLTGPSPSMGSINVTNSSTVSAIVSPVPAGMGYALTLNGTSTDGQTMCSGMSGSFNVNAGMTTTVMVAVACHKAKTTGSVLIQGNINVCAEISSVSATPPVGNTIAITAMADDPDSAPGPITYQWTTSSGTLSSATVANPTLTCTQPGTVNLTLTVSDGDPACSDTFGVTVACPPDSALNESAWVEIGANNQAIARLITPYSVCPSITVDGVTSPMNVRVGPGTIPLRATNSDPTPGPAVVNSKPSVFPVSTCEFNIPSGAMVATVAGKSLPLPKASVQRVVVIGDTGCRISIGNPFQACGDPTQWPFSVISSVAAGMHPDLVLHVGDYHYRDNPCGSDPMQSPNQPQCVGTPWGYGYDVWNADLFQPAAPLLAAAPWIMVRGNHETCNRAGQGWYRFLDTQPYSAMKSCDLAANDNVANYNGPWAVTVDGDTQFIAFDSANTSKSYYTFGAGQKAGDVVPVNNYTAELATAAGFSSNMNLFSIFAVHHPVLGYTPVAGAQPGPGNPGLQSVMNFNYPNAFYPPGVAMAMHGHVHDFQAVSFSSGHPATFVAGHGGDNLDATFPATITSGPVKNTDFTPNTTVTVGEVTTQDAFGFLVMDRVGPKNWSYTAYKTDGSVLTRCTQVSTACSGSCDPTPGTQITCSPNGSL